MRPIDRAQRVLVMVAVVTVVILVATGVWLSFTYRPDAAQAWPSLEPGADPGGIAGARLVHRLATAALLLLALALLVVAAVASRRWRSPTLLLILTGVLGFTGFLLAWDQLALWAVTTGEDYRGMWAAAFSDDVRFVIVGGMEVSQATLATWFVVHLALGAVLVGVLALVAKGVYRRSVPASSPAPPTPPAPLSPPTSAGRWSNQSSTARS